jgi:hypothetical protein
LEDKDMTKKQIGKEKKFKANFAKFEELRTEIMAGAPNA